MSPPHPRSVLPWILLALMLLSGCDNPREEVRGDEFGCQAAVKGIMIRYPASVVVAGYVIPRDFNVNSYFGVLDHLSMAEGYTLDWVYSSAGQAGTAPVLGAKPFLYARRLDDARLRTFAEFTSKVPPPLNDYSPTYLEHVQPDGTEQSYLQLVLLELLGERFYLYWHAAYGDIAVVCDDAAIDGAIASQLYGYESPPPSLTRKAHRIKDIAPTVEVGQDTVRVQIVTFSRFEGFARQTFTINKAGSPRIAVVESEVLVPYDVGIFY